MEFIIEMDRSPYLNYDVFLEIINDGDYYHVTAGEDLCKDIDLGNTQRFLGMALIDDIIKRYKERHPTATVDEQRWAIMYYWQNNKYLDK